MISEIAPEELLQTAHDAGVRDGRQRFRMIIRGLEVRLEIPPEFVDDPVSATEYVVANGAAYEEMRRNFEMVPDPTWLESMIVALVIIGLLVFGLSLIGCRERVRPEAALIEMKN